MRVGLGFDIHPFSTDPTRPLRLGGVTVEGPGLEGHSDADVACHAVADALLGAAGLGDIGTIYPASDASLAGVDSTRLLREVVARVGQEWSVANVDCTIIAEAPKLAGVRQAMQESLSSLVGAPVTVKAKRGEGLGAVGRQEGIACMAVALLEAK